MYSPLENVFENTMKREGKEITVVNSGTTFQGFFRRFDDGQSTEDRITVYYGVNEPVYQGTLISYGTKTYILINKETEENTCYYKSFGIACNGILNTNNGTIRNVNVYGYDMKNGIAYTGNVFTMISGNMEFITESNDTIRTLNINDTFNTYGRTWKVDNTYDKDGIFHIVAKVTTAEADPVEPEPEPEPTPTSSVTISASTDTIKVGGSYKTLTATIYDLSETDMTENYSDATFTWTCDCEGTDLTDTVSWYKGSYFYQKKIKFPDNRDYLAKMLNIKCTITTTDGITIEGSKEYKITI